MNPLIALVIWALAFGVAWFVIPWRVTGVWWTTLSKKRVREIAEDLADEIREGKWGHWPESPDDMLDEFKQRAGPLHCKIPFDEGSGMLLEAFYSKPFDFEGFLTGLRENLEQEMAHQIREGHIIMPTQDPPKWH
jgi:hypothetical protein